MRGGISATAAIALALGFAASAQCAESYPSDTTQPDYVALLSDFTNYYEPDPSESASGLSGRVINADVLRANSSATTSVNHKTNEGRSDDDPLNPQQQRALKDSDMIFEDTLPDALGPTLGTFLKEGLAQGDLPLSSELLVDQKTTMASETRCFRITCNTPR